MNTTEHTDAMRDKLANDLKLVIQDAEELLRSTGQQVNEGYQAARVRFESTLNNAKNDLSVLEQRVFTGTRDALETADEYVRANPWQSVGIGAVAGLFIGLLVGRR